MSFVFHACAESTCLKNTQLLTKESDFYPSNKCLMRKGKSPHCYIHTYREVCTLLWKTRSQLFSAQEITETSFSPNLRARPEMCLCIHQEEVWLFRASKWIGRPALCLCPSSQTLIWPVCHHSLKTWAKWPGLYFQSDFSEDHLISNCLPFVPRQRQVLQHAWSILASKLTQVRHSKATQERGSQGKRTKSSPTVVLLFLQL